MLNEILYKATRELENIMPKHSDETMSYGQFSAVREFFLTTIKNSIQQAFEETRVEKKEFKSSPMPHDWQNLENHLIGNRVEGFNKALTQIQTNQDKFMGEPKLIEQCPNCLDPNPEIETMSDGSCGVCAGKGTIEWKKVGKLKFMGENK